MPAHKSWKRYLLSFGEELLAQADRVRNLIGPAHWPSDGAIKESILIELLRRHTPSTVLVGRGFVLADTEEGGCSREIDVLLLDVGSSGPIFNQGDLIMGLPSQALGAISVKTRLDKDTVNSVVENLNSARALLGTSLAAKFWSGGFFYEASASPKKVIGIIADALSAHRPSLPTAPPSRAFPFGPHFFCTARDDVYIVRYGDPMDDRAGFCAEIRHYACGGAASAVFLADLLGHLADTKGDRDSSLSSLIGDGIATISEESVKRIDLP